MLPLLTVLMPNYNNAPFLKEAIDSVLNQTYENFIFLIVDDGSTDEGVKIIKSYTDKRIVLIEKERNSGIVDTLNTGLETIQTRYLIRMDGDDVSSPERFKTLIDFMQNNPEIDVCGSQMQIFGNDNTVTTYYTDRAKLKAHLIYNTPVAHSSVIIRTSVLKSNSVLYRNVHPYMEDYDLFWRLKKHAKYANLKNVLYYYRVLTHNSTIKNYNTRLDRYRVFFKQVLIELDIEPSSKNIEMHLECFIKPTISFSVRECRKWMDYLLFQNNKAQIYPQDGLEEVIRERWEQLFYKLASNSLMKTVHYFIINRTINKDKLLYLIKIRLTNFLKGSGDQK